MKHTTIEQELREQGRCLIQTVGVSMEPLLHNRYTTVVLKKKEAPPRRGDVVLFRRQTGDPQAASCEYVLHRVIRTRGEKYFIRGDNCLQTDSCLEEQILGVMAGFFNGETYTDCAASSAYSRYTHTLWLRYGRKRLRALCAAALRLAKNPARAMALCRKAQLRHLGHPARTPK